MLSHDAYASADEALVTFVGPRVGGPAFALRQIAPSWVDFLGTVRGPGRYGQWHPVAFDAKTRAEHPTFRLDNRAWDKEARQAAQLAKLRARGWLTFFCVCALDAEVRTAYVVTDLDALLAGDGVPLYRRTPAGIVHLCAGVAEATALQLAQGRPRWDWRAALPVAFPSLLD